MLLQRLWHFRAVVDEGSISAAAARLHVAQPALSRQIAALEREVGTELLHRERRGVRTTAAGDALRQASLEVFDRLVEAANAAIAAHGGTSGYVRLGVARLAIDSDRVARGIASVRRELPGIQLEVGDVTSLHQAQSVRAREIDLAIGLADFEGDATVKREVLYDEQIDHVLVAAHHPLALRSSIDVSDLRAYTLLSLRRPLSGGYPRMYDAMQDAGITQVEEHDTPEGLYAMAAAGRGWGIASRSQIANPPLGTRVVALRGLAFALQVSLRWRGADRSRAVLNVIRVLKSAICGDANDARADDLRRDAEPSRVHDIALEHLMAFLAVVEEGSMSEAAVRLRLTQSGVSRRVRALEVAVGCALVERGAHGVFATNAGEAFMPGAERVMRLSDLAVSRARQAGGDIAGVCRIGAMPPELTGSLQNAALRRVVEEFPRVRIELEEMLPERQSRLLLSGEIDIGLGGEFPGMDAPVELAAVQLFEDVIDSVLLAEGHPLASRAWIRADDLAGEPFLFIDRTRGPRMYDAVTRGLAEAGIAAGVSAFHGGPREVWRSLAGGGGWTIGTRSQRARPPAGLVGVPVEGLHIPWGVSLLWRRDLKDPVVRHVLEVFRTTKNPEVAVVVATVRAPVLPSAFEVETVS